MSDDEPESSVDIHESGAADAPKTPDQRIADLEQESRNQRASVKRAERELWIGIAFVAGLLVVSMMAIVVASNTRNATTRDDNLDDLLTQGAHCYGSSEEMAATRQRALAAIDRINWDRDHPTPTTTEGHPDPMLSNGASGNPPRQKTIAVVKGTYPGLKKLDDTVDVDDDLCFGIQISTW